LANTTGAKEKTEAIEVTPLAPRLVNAAGRVLGKAFRNDPAMMALLDGLDGNERERRLGWYYSDCLSACCRRGWPLGIQDRGRTVAAAVIYPPGTYPLPWMEELRIDLAILWRGGLFKEKNWRVAIRGTAMQNEMDRDHPKQAHYYLQWIGVAPDRQGQGLGSRIIGQLAARADREQVGCYLETANQRNVPFYQRFGYRTAVTKMIKGVRGWFMWRDPR
jgi:GNAT superfamily N-acetyltransferase